MKKIIASLMLVSLVLVGCGGEKSNTVSKTKCTTSQQGIEISMILEDTNKKISGMSAEYKMDLGEEIDKETQELTKQMTLDQYKEYEGLTIDMAFEGTVMVMNMNFDLDKLDELPAEFQGFAGQKIKGENIDDAVKGVEMVGFSCKAE